MAARADAAVLFACVHSRGLRPCRSGVSLSRPGVPTWSRAGCR